MSRRVDIRQAEDRRDVIHQAVHVLSEGGLVAFPTETMYLAAAHALRGDAVQRLAALQAAKSRSSDESGHPATEGCVLAVKSAGEATDYVPGISPLGKKLCRRCWPGPVTLGFTSDATGGLLDALPAESRAAVIDADGVLPIRSPAHPLISEVMRLLPSPLVVSRDQPGTLREASDAERTFGAGVDLILDGGTCRYGEPSTVVVVSGAAWKLRSSGVVTETAVGRLASEIYLFVCTGNTCRSPLAEGIFRKLLSERMGCGEEELLDRGYVVASAGLSAAAGAQASTHSLTVASRLGIDLRGHESQPLTDRLLDQADHVFAMTRWHLESILSARPDLRGKIDLLSRQKSDVSDPVGGTLDDYERCAEELDRNLRSIVGQIPLN